MRPLPVETRRVLFDISRLVRSYDKSFATGVDRIDLAIGLDLVRRFGDECHFVHAGHHGICLLPQSLGQAVLQHLQTTWNDDVSAATHIGSLMRLRLALEPYIRNILYRPDDHIVSLETTYVVASHTGVGKKKGGMRRLDPFTKMKRILYIHDIIPVEFPEYQRPETFQVFSHFLNELTDAPVIAVSNSCDTDKRLRDFARQQAWQLESSSVIIPSLTFQPSPAAPVSPKITAFLEDTRPYFVALGTIEPRKNHLLLLQIWRDMAHLQAPSRLCIIGKRGWENENVIDMLDRCRQLDGNVFEFAGLSDFEVQTVLKNATALLFPSFAEGLGIPILEAEALGVPCVVSDIPVFREISPDGTVFLDPLDGTGWRDEIMARGSRDYTEKRKAVS